MPKPKASPKSISIVHLFLLGMLAVTIIAISALSYLWVSSINRRFHRESELIRKDFDQIERTTLQNEIGKIFAYIEYMRTTTETRLKNKIKSQVCQSHAVAETIYNQYKNTHSLPEIKDMVRETLRPIRFNNKRGYYFAFQLDGVDVLFPDRPETEGQNLLQLQDAEGKYIIRDMIEIARTQGEGFYQYHSIRPNSTGLIHKKISFVKYFEPFDWLIGTGEYIDDVTTDIQQEILQWIGKIRFGRTGYIFISKYDGTILVNGSFPELVGKNFRTVIEPNGADVAEKLKQAIKKPDGEFISYGWPKPSTGKIEPKLSFVKAYPEWQWIIGGGVYTGDIEKYIAFKHRELQDSLREQLINALLLSLFILIIVALAALYLSRRLKQEFDVFNAYMESVAKGDEYRIPRKKFFLRELRMLVNSINRMLEQRRNIEYELMESQDRFRELAELLPQTIFEINLEGQFTFVNRHGLETFGYTQEDLKQGVHAAQVIHPDEHLRLNQNMAEILLGGTRATGRQHTCITKDSEILPTLIYAAPIMRNKKRLGIRGTVVDISEIKKVENALKKAKESAEAANMAKSQFLANMSHEIRTPLNGIIGFTEILLEQEDTPEKKEMLALIRNSSGSLMDLINNILDISKVEADKLMLEELDFNIKKLTGLVVKKLAPQAEEKQLKLFHSIDPELPDTVMGDPLRVEQILMNLLNNAVKFTQQGTVNLSIEKISQPGDILYTRIIVTDTGIGIPTEKINTIFDKFSQAEDYITRQFGGTGLGLAITKKLVELMDGTINVESQAGKGTRFTIEIPFRLPGKEFMKPSPAKTATLRESGSPYPTLRILVAEDNKTNQKLIERLAKSRSWQTDIVPNGKEAVEKFRVNRYDLVLMDIQMPIMNGFDAAREIRETENETENHAIIIALTAYAMKGDRDKCIAAGMDDYIPKPITRTQFFEIIDSYFQK